VTSAPPSPETLGVALPAGRAGLPQALRTEWTKFWSVRSTGWTLLATAVAVLGLCVLATATNQNGPVPDPTRRSLIGLFLGQLIIGVLGVLVMSAEYGTGSIFSTLAAMPRRPVVLAAKAIVLGAVTVVASEILAFAAFLIGQAILSGSGRNHAALTDPGVTRAVVGGGLYLVVLGLLALGLATIIRHTAGAIAAYAGVLLVLPLIVQALPQALLNAISRYLPANIGLVIISSRPEERLLGVPTFSPWAGFALLAGYGAAMLVLGGWLMVRRDA
jgi:ABC-2 type transport system permease protein